MIFSVRCVVEKGAIKPYQTVPARAEAGEPVSPNKSAVNGLGWPFSFWRSWCVAHTTTQFEKLTSPGLMASQGSLRTAFGSTMESSTVSSAIEPNCAMPKTVPKVALFYDEGAYVETIERPAQMGKGKPAGLMGRQVAGKEFLDAYLSHGSWKELAAVTTSEAATQSLYQFCQDHPTSRGRRRVLFPYELKDFHETFFPTAPASIVHFPCPPSAKFAWARQHGGSASFAISGVTHTLCSPDMVNALCQMVTAPFEPYDTLICTSQAVVQMVRSVTSTYAAYLKDRFGGNPRLRMQLETIPLGVNPDKFLPATPEQRAAKRHELDVAEEEIAVLFVGRLSHHGKAHPFPMFHGLSQAARTTGKKVHLILAGWTANNAVRQAFEEGARVLAPNIRVSIIDGTHPNNRTSVWHAADVFTSFSDNIQETFGLVIVEAMACGLPVVASDWNGYRDLVVDGETGFLVSTTMVENASRNSTSRALLGEINYDHFLAETSQCVSVDSFSAAEAFARLIQDAELRQKMGTAGRQRVLERFTWSRVIKSYEDLWRRQNKQRLAHIKAAESREQTIPGPAIYPPLEHSFFGYPTCWIQDDHEFQAVCEAEDRVDVLLSMPLTNHESHQRCSDPQVIRDILHTLQSPCTLSRLCSEFKQTGVEHTQGLATLAWMIKYDLIRPVSPLPSGNVRNHLHKLKTAVLNLKWKTQGSHQSTIDWDDRE